MEEKQNIEAENLEEQQKENYKRETVNEITALKAKWDNQDLFVKIGKSSAGIVCATMALIVLVVISVGVIRDRKNYGENLYTWYKIVSWVGYGFWLMFANSLVGDCDKLIEEILSRKQAATLKALGREKYMLYLKGVKMGEIADEKGMYKKVSYLAFALETAGEGEKRLAVNIIQYVVKIGLPGIMGLFASFFAEKLYHMIGSGVNLLEIVKDLKIFVAVGIVSIVIFVITLIVTLIVRKKLMQKSEEWYNNLV